ncbi:MAG: transposase [Holosporaceae bacterium]|nr:transposase [Holosporaceae bacterium]
MDAKTGYSEKIVAKPANVSEYRTLAEVVDSVNARRIYIDKGYASAENRAFLRQKTKSEAPSCIMRPAKINRLEKVHGQFLLKSLAFNLLKTVNAA